MNDLISRSALLEKQTYMFDDALGTSPCVLTEDIKAAPAVDAVEVVRCENCIYNDSETHIPGFVYCNFFDSTKDFDGYCDEGEKRDDAKE